MQRIEVTVQIEPKNLYVDPETALLKHNKRMCCEFWR